MGFELKFKENLVFPRYRSKLVKLNDFTCNYFLKFVNRITIPLYEKNEIIIRMNFKHILAYEPYLQYASSNVHSLSNNIYILKEFVTLLPKKS